MKVDFFDESGFDELVFCRRPMVGSRMGGAPKGWGQRRGGAPKNDALGLKPRRTHESPRGQTCTFEFPGLQKHHQNSTIRPPERERKRTKMDAEEGKKSEILGGQAEGGSVEGGRAEGGPAEGGPAEGGPHNPNHATPHELDFRPHTTHTTHTNPHTHQHTHAHTHTTVIWVVWAGRPNSVWA